MKKTKEKILETSLKLFNEFGFQMVSLRKIASVMKISHGNLIYHFKSKEDIVEALHKQLLDKAIEENQKIIQNENLILDFISINRVGLSFVYDYRFFFLDLVQIMKEYKNLHQQFVEIEKIRFSMYADLIQKLIDLNLMREKEYEKEYEEFIERIRVFSDFWISSSIIYDNLCREETVEKHLKLLTTSFYPYLTELGKEKLLIITEK